MMPRALLLALLVVLPGAATAALPLPDAPSAVHVALDVTAHRASVDKSIQWTLGFQKPDGGVYEYAFLQKDSNAVAALRLYARAQSLDLRGPQFQALVGYWETTQRVDGSWGSGFLVPDITADAIDGLLEAGYDRESTLMKRALLYVELDQNLDGSWTDGGGAASGSLTARNVENLLNAGHGRSEEKIQRAVSWLLTLQDPADGGFAPTPGWFTTPAATALVLSGLDAYLLASPTGPETVPQATVQAAVDRALDYLGATWDPQRGDWQASTGATCLVVGPAAHYYASRGLALPGWVTGGARHILDHTNANGAVTNWQGTPLLDWTLSGAASLLEVPRSLGQTATLPLQTTHNDAGEYDAQPVTVTLLDANGNVRATAGGPAGFATLSWSGLPMGRYVVRAESAGAATFERVLWRV